MEGLGVRLKRNADPAPRTEQGAAFERAAAGASTGVPYRDEMEQSFGEDFGGVRAVAGGPAAEDGLRAIGASAAARGETIEFASASPSRELVAHELTHVVQARHAEGASGVSFAGGGSTSAAEQEADEVAARVVAGQRVGVLGASAGAVRRHEDLDANVGSIQRLIYDALQQGADGCAEIVEIQQALENPVPAADDDGSSSGGESDVFVFGQSYRLRNGDVCILLDEAYAAERRMTEPAPAPASPKPPAPMAPPIAPTSPSDVPDDVMTGQSIPGPSAGTMIIREKIVAAAYAHDDARLGEIHDALVAAYAAADVFDDASQASAAGAPVMLDGDCHSIPRDELQELIVEVDQATELPAPQPPGPLADKLPPQIDLTKVRVSFTLPEGCELTGARRYAGEHHVLTTATTTITISLTRGRLLITANPPIHVRGRAFILVPFWSDVPRLSIDFASGAIDVEADGKAGDTIQEQFSEAIAGWIAGTPVAQPGYDPLQDPDLPGTIQKIAANLTSGSEPDPSAIPANFGGKDVRNLSATATIEMKTPFAWSGDGGGVSIPAGGVFTVGVSSMGSLGGDGAGGAAPTDLERIDLTSGAITLLAGGEPIAKLTSLTVNRGGTVTVNSFEPLGKAKDAADWEALFRLIGIAAQLHEHGVADEPAFGMASAHDDTKPKFVVGMTKRMIEDALTPAVQKLIRDNAHAVPGLDLANMIGVE